MRVGRLHRCMDFMTNAYESEFVYMLMKVQIFYSMFLRITCVRSMHILFDRSSLLALELSLFTI
uniref:Uncharacterized protein n=1 Tax=Arundo donax TaxID=35708 RepID=A0A0A9CIK1_ARUDO